LLPQQIPLYFTVGTERLEIFEYNELMNKKQAQKKPLFLKNGVFWDVTPRGSYKKRRFGRSQALLHHGDKNRRTRNNVNTTRRNIPEDTILHSHSRENLKSYPLLLLRKRNIPTEQPSLVGEF
jgi:hypothetical protein